MKQSIAVLCLVVALSGCHNPFHSPAPVSTVPGTTTSDPNAARNAQIIQVATAQAVALGLNVYANEGHRDEALVIATKIKEMVGSSALAYLNGTTGASSAAVNTFMNSQFVNLPGEAQSFISLAATLLDTYLPAPSANSVIDADQLSYIKAFFQGLSDGATQFAANPPAVKAVPNAKAVRQKSVAAWFNTAK